MIVSTLRLNPQLNHFQLGRFDENTVKIIQTMNEYNKNLENFTINLNYPFLTYNYDGKMWHLNHVKRLDSSGARLP